MPNEIIQKSIRLPADMVAYIEEQEGKNFTSKLMYILDNYRYGERDRIKMQESLDANIVKQVHRLEELTDAIYQASDVLRKCGQFLKKANDIFDSYGDNINQ